MAWYHLLSIFKHIYTLRKIGNRLKCKFVFMHFWFIIRGREPFFILDSKQWLNDNLCTFRENAILSQPVKNSISACIDLSKKKKIIRAHINFAGNIIFKNSIYESIRKYSIWFLKCNTNKLFLEKMFRNINKFGILFIAIILFKCTNYYLWMLEYKTNILKITSL